MEIFYIALAAALAFMALIRITAKKKTFLGRLCKGYWNINFKLASYIPFCGWMSRFIIAESEAELKQKEEYIKIGAMSDGFAADALESAAERERLRVAKEEKIRQELVEKYGATDISISNDNTSATCVDKDGNSYNIHIDWE